MQSFACATNGVSKKEAYRRIRKKRKRFDKITHQIIYTMALLAISQAEYVSGYKIALTFNNGVNKTVDLSNHLHGEIFEPLHNIEKFKNFQLSYYTIEWENGADLAPEYLYSL